MKEHYAANQGGRRGMRSGVLPAPTGRILRACPACDARPGHRCVIWVVSGGERLYIKCIRKKLHDER